jgi:plastocyanin
MTLVTGNTRSRYAVARLATLLVAVVALGACSSSAAPSPGGAAAPTTGTPAVTAVTPTSAPSTMPSLKPSPSVTAVKITPIQGAPDSKMTVQVVASHTKWIPADLTAPAGKVWHVKIEDRDSNQHHNFTVASGRTFEERIYQVTNFVQGSYTFDIPALPAGTYLFICTLHPESMTGNLTLK